MKKYCNSHYLEQITMENKNGKNWIERLKIIRGKTDIGVILSKFGVLFGFIILVIVSTILNPRFLTPTNILNVIRQISIFGIIAIGQTFVILISGIDLSVGSILALVVVLTGGFLPEWGILPTIILGLIVGTVIGVINGIGVTIGNVQPFVMTLGMLGIARGLAFLYTGGMPIPVLNPKFLFIGNGYFFNVIPVPAVLFVSLVIIAALILNYTPFGRYVYAIGSNSEAARLSGIKVDRVKTTVYALCGLTSAIAGIVYASQLAVAPAIAGEGYELDAIAAVVVGGADMFGGEGGMFGTFLGAAIIGSLSNILNLTGVNPFVQKLAKGVLIIAAVIVKGRGRKQ
jgi:ribose/xylose/arabinose/galactoside ABC-type transport system permease subunit